MEQASQEQLFARAHMAFLSATNDAAVVITLRPVFCAAGFLENLFLLFLKYNKKTPSVCSLTFDDNRF